MTAAPIEAGMPIDSAAREARFTASVRRLRTKVTGAAVERWFRLAGPVLIPLGALMIVLAWWGAANTTRVFLQIPYLISGAILGLGFMFVGGFVYFARWQTDLLDAVRAESRRAEDAARRTTDALERIETLLRTSQGPAAQGDPAPVEVASVELVATTHGRLVHRADCRLVTGRPTQPVSPTDVDEQGMCRICLPDGIHT